MNKLKTAVIGVGNMGSQYALLIGEGQIEGMELVALTRVRSPYTEKLENILKRGIIIYQTADALFDAVEAGDLKLDAVVIATPHYAHEEEVKRAFALGLSVMCDKPAGVYLRQARLMNEAYEAAKKKNDEVVYGMVFNQRTYPLFQTLHSIVSSKKYGEIKRVNWVVTDWYRPEKYYSSSSWHSTWEKDGGGVLLNQCPHNLDILQWICGMPQRVTAFCHEGKYHDIEVEDEVTAYLEWSNGATGVFVSSTGEAPGINRLELSLDEALIVCENGEIRIGELYPEIGCSEREYRNKSEDFFKKLNGVWHTITPDKQEDQYKKILEAFSEACHGEGSLIAEGVDGIKSLYLSNAMYLSSWTHKSVEIAKIGDAGELDFEAEFLNALNRKMNGKKI